MFVLLFRFIGDPLTRLDCEPVSLASNWGQLLYLVIGHYARPSGKFQLLTLILDSGLVGDKMASLECCDFSRHILSVIHKPLSLSLCCLKVRCVSIVPLGSPVVPP
jgi:hypothetical protein